jgi:hypothetical protein
MTDAVFGQTRRSRGFRYIVKRITRSFIARHGGWLVRPRASMRQGDGRRQPFEAGMALNSLNFDIAMD